MTNQPLSSLRVSCRIPGQTVLYIDTGNIIGYSIPREEAGRVRLLAHGQINLKAAAGLAELDALFALAARYRCGVACESPMGGGNPKTFRIVCNQRMREGQFRELARQHGLPWLGMCNPATVKKAFTGDGRADKAKVVFMANQLFGLALTVKEEHAADAIAGGLLALEGRFAEQGKAAKEKRARRALVKKAGGLF